MGSKLETGPNRRGRFGVYGGRYVPETVMFALDELESAYRGFRRDRTFQNELKQYLRDYVGRPTPLYFAERFTEHLGGPKVWFKREDLNHTGAHKINNTVGQILLARAMGKQRIIAETGAGQHGLATATVCARFGMNCVVYMGEEDIHRQAPNVEKMNLLGAKVVPVSSGSATLKDATSEALRDWVTNVRSTFYIIGSVVGPHPYPHVDTDLANRLIPKAKIGLKYPIRTSGISLYLRTASTRRSVSVILIPFDSATPEESCISGPSAIGSENGIPISIMSAPVR